MDRNKCPHCRHHSFGIWAKLALNPKRPKPCPVCGELVSVTRHRSALHLLGIVPMTLCLLGIAFANSSSWGQWILPVTGVIIGFAIEIWLYYRCVPLVAGAA